MKAALRKSAGVFSLAARELGCDRANVKQRVDRSPELQEFVANIHREIEDLADSVIIDAMNEKVAGSTRPTKEARAMARWFKGHQLRMQGFTLKLANADGSPLQIAPVEVTVTYVDATPGPDDEEIPA